MALLCGCRDGVFFKKSNSLRSVMSNLSGVSTEVGADDVPVQETIYSPGTEEETIYCSTSTGEYDLLSEGCGRLRRLSDAGSVSRYAEPSQTLIILDWDETLFPTSELVYRLGMGHSFSCRRHLPEGFEEQLHNWQVALEQYLQQACHLSDRVVIVTNAKRPWVADCVDAVAPNLKALFESPEGPQVVYAGEEFKACQRRHDSGLRLRPAQFPETRLTLEEMQEHLTMAKYAAMKQQVEGFYSKYKGQSWKNILCIGDSDYERHAIQEVAFQRQSVGRECLRTKTVLLPTEPSLTELTLRLRFSVLMLEAEVEFNGDIDLDLREVDDPLEEIGLALQIPQLASAAIDESLNDVAVTVCFFSGTTNSYSKSSEVGDWVHHAVFA